MRIPFATRLKRPLVALLSPLDVWCWIECRSCGADTAIPASTAAAAATATSARQRQATNVAPMTPTSSAAKLDCENEMRRPSHRTTIAATTTGASTRTRSMNEQHDAREDRDDEEPPVHRRVPEHGVDAEERRVGVRVDHLRVLEDVTRLVLVEADDREHEPHHDDLDVEQR